MFAESLMSVYESLLTHYGPQGWWPIRGKRFYSKPLTDNERFEVIVGAVLTQNTNWNNVEKALQNLRQRGLMSREALGQVSEKTLAEAIKPAGYYNQKAKKLRLVAGFDGEITRDNLLGIWGIGLETADSILLYAYEKSFFVIDAYTKRLLYRLGFTEKEDTGYDDLQRMFHRNLPGDINIYKEFHALIVRHCKDFCRKKPLCRGCILAEKCAFRT